MPRKLVLVVVDSLRTDMLERAVEAGSAPTFSALLDRGELIGDCVSSFPSVTPVCTSEIITGQRPDGHRIPGMNWYHRAEQRYVEYGSSWEATRTFGLFSALYDTVYNMNMAHLSPQASTLYEDLADRGLRTAGTPFLIYRGRTRHELGLEGLLGRVASAAKFHHAVWGPEELFYGELYASRKVPCKPTLARPNRRDDYSACVGVEMVERDLYDFMLFSLPDNDYHSHRFGPEASEESIAHADECFGAIVEAGGGIDEFLADNAVILMADHSQSDVETPFDVAGLLGADWQVLQPNEDAPEQAELAFGPSSRAGGVWMLREGSAGIRLHSDVRETLAREAGTDLLAWLVDADGRAIVRTGVGTPTAAGVCVERDGATLRFAPGESLRDRRSQGWALEGDPATLELETSEGMVDSALYPDCLSRLWSALRSPYAADLLLSRLARPRARRLGWRDTYPRRQPRLTAGRRLFGAAAHRWRRGRAPRARAMGDQRCRRAGPRPLRGDRRAPLGSDRRQRLVSTEHEPEPEPRSEAPPPGAPAARGGAEGEAATSRAAEIAWHLARRVRSGARRPANWVQLFQFAVVGGTGYIVNLAVFAILTHGADVNYVVAALAAFAVAVSNNFVLNRLWTFRSQGAREHHAGFQAFRFIVVSLVGLLVNLIILALLVDGFKLPELPSQAFAVAAATPVNFVGNKLWTFRRNRPVR